MNPLGAELWSLTDAAGRELTTDADPAFWTGHAPVLFPIVGRLRGDSYRLNGREYSLPQHGFSRRSMFRIAAQDDASGLFRRGIGRRACREEMGNYGEDTWGA